MQHSAYIYPVDKNVSYLNFFTFIDVISYHIKNKPIDSKPFQNISIIIVIHNLCLKSKRDLFYTRPDFVDPHPSLSEFKDEKEVPAPVIAFAATIMSLVWILFFLSDMLHLGSLNFG
jgi:hypothetical protein